MAWVVSLGGWSVLGGAYDHRHRDEITNGTKKNKSREAFTKKRRKREDPGILTAASKVRSSNKNKGVVVNVNGFKW